jgi:hypothetical protein
VGALAIAAALAFARWYAMSDPGHFSFWLPESWFRGEARSLTRAALNVLCSGFFLFAVPLAGSLWWASSGRGLRGGADEAVGLARLWGVRWVRSSSTAWWYVWAGLLVGGVGVALFAVRYAGGVREMYPVYRGALSGDAGDVVVAEALTVGMILFTELFYRGFFLFKTEQSFGVWAVYLLLPVYVLDHVGACWAEVAGSVVAGAVLGHLALQARSIWPGFFVHAGCAVSVDLASIYLFGG